MAVIGKKVCDLAPGNDNPRNSEGAFITLKDGRIMFVYSRFFGDSWHDYAPAHIAARYSADGGRTWSAEDRILFTREQFDAENIMSVSLLRLPDDTIALFFIIRYGWHDSREYMFTSNDEGETWSKGTCCVPPVGYYVTNNDRAIRTQSGRLLVPGNLHREKAGHTFDERGIAYFFYSDDNGATWEESPDCCFPPSNKITSGLQETALVELKNGTIWALFRTNIGRQYQSFSFDGGLHWTDPAPSYFTAPTSPISVKRLPDCRLLAVWNPTPLYHNRDRSNDGGWGGRTPLVAALSSDEGSTWTNTYILEDGSEDAGYCYCAIHPMEDAVLLAYCAGSRTDGGCLNRLRIRRIDLKEFTS